MTATPKSSVQAYCQPIEELLSGHSTALSDGLSTEEAGIRLKEHGRNRLKEADKVSPLGLFLAQFKNPLLIILMVGALISAYTGHWVDAIAIFVIVLINAFISFWQEFKAEQSLAALNEMSAPLALVLRDGAYKEHPAADLVPGDIVKLKAGDIVPADMRFAEAHRLQIDEAALTGESEPIDKHDKKLADDETILAERFNMGFMSTQVTNGTAIGVVTATGMQTEVGHIADLMASAKEPKTPLQERIESLSRVLIAAALLVVAIVIGIGIFNGMDALEMLNTAISLSVAAIPEGLPTVVTIVLTLGSQNMAANNALARRLSSVETLGTTSVICSDKTGTLTQNQMQVMRLWAGGKSWKVSGEGFDPNGFFLDENDRQADVDAEHDLRRMLMISAYCNDARLVEADGRFTVQGNPTEGALVVAAAKAGISRADLKQQDYATLAKFPFDSSRKMMSVHVSLPTGEEALVAKGAPDIILKRATHVRLHDAEIPLTDDVRAQIEAVITEFGSQALRTLAVAYRVLDDDGFDENDPERDIVLIGIHGIMDPPRPEVAGAVAEAASAGVRTVMITGDHAQTARAIAERIGIKHAPWQTVHTGVELDGMDDAELAAAAQTAAVFARVTPEHKLRIVTALQADGEVAAMTGDGVNDAPALRKSDIGVAMGITGTSVAKDSAALVLLDDNFSTIVKAVREGRRIYDNLRKFIRQALTANVAEVSTILFAFVLMGADPLLPLTPLMILWVNLISDGIPALSLGFEPADPDLMERPPRSRDENIFSDGLKEKIVLRGLAVGGITFAVFIMAINRGQTLEYAQTLAFATLIFAQLWHIFDARSNTTLFRVSPLGNPLLVLAVGVSAVLSLLAIYTPPGQFVLGTVPLSGRHLLEAIFIAGLPTLALSGVKEIFGLKNL
ncbi:cation-translocating P-type ATPase [Roseibium aggregatum]|uniref:Cation-translocating P-type ATPase n=1 Tax=Roseibium aggregatum TaxID=187304 RepID=A0A939E975_9HYPH|nr:cation-translocating P-type ATPase [Roseibium aggregatum]MBN9669196.1 cation-translocating P-type ATPase [Roseibium aggregatum]